MMPFAKHLFISYAHIDNRPLTSEQKGWITRFHESLDSLLSTRMGGKARIWRDEKLQGNDIFADEGKHYVTLFILADYDSGTPLTREPHKCEKWTWIPWPPYVHPCFLPITNLLKQNFKLPY